ncbi:MAG TPA: LytR C-terminal domain-containing protein, partial [Longimicrobium sp.]|nr:LytR C-terminal domain-containing protein [Longimicrobium sp.]
LAAGLMGRRGGGAEDVAAADSARSPGRSPVPRPAGRVRVEVLNASGVPGLARRGTEVLRDGGYDVVSYGNAPGFAPDSSLVLDRVGRMEVARSVADAVQIPRVYARPDSNVYVDVTVVLGKDWAAENAEEPATEAEVEP